MTASTGRGGHRQPGSVTVCWARPSHDGQVHAFPLVEDPLDRNREALCSHTTSLTGLNSRVDSPRFPSCARGQRTPQ